MRTEGCKHDSMTEGIDNGGDSESRCDRFRLLGSEPGPQLRGVSAHRGGRDRGADAGAAESGEHAVPGGFGAAIATCDDAHLVAFAVVNAVGDVVGDDGRILAGSTAPPDALAFAVEAPFEEEAAHGNTTLVVVATDAACDKLGCHLVAQSAHDGMARALRPAHTRFDGDLTITLATGAIETNLDRLRAVAADLVTEAIRSAPR